MTTKITRVGNTLTVEVPEELVEQASLPVGEPVEWVANGDGSIALVRPSTNPRGRRSLEQILEGIPEGVSLGEFDWGNPRGAEVW
jgi:antitoxin component of MazEF toxin-antitoxin module